jgi:hypothetical protein
MSSVEKPGAPRAAVVKALSSAEHNEEVIARGIIDGRMFELWRSPKGTFSATLTHADNGMTCLIASGTSLHPVGPVLKAPAL